MDNKKIIRFPIFLILAYISAFIFEIIPRFILIEIFKIPGVEHLWQIPGIFWFFWVWYGFIFAIAYSIFINKKLRWAVTYGIIIGMLAETFLFQEMNIYSFFIFPFLYGGMFYLPFRLIRYIIPKSQSK